MALYDKYYTKENYFGKPLGELIEFFQGCRPSNLVDLGAGQGRNSIPLSKMGYKVTAVDICEKGLNQIEQQDKRITTIKRDIEDFDVSEFDYILADSMLHFYSRDLQKEEDFVLGILRGMKKEATYINCMMKSDKAEGIIKELIEQSCFEFSILKECYVKYKEANCDYHMMAVKKTK